MAPTICSEKESRVRRIMRRRSSSSSVISYVGKITHRRTVAMRNASSKLASSRLSEKLSSCESDSNEDSVQSKMDLQNSDSLDNSRNSPAISESSTNQEDCSDRFISTLSPDSGYMTPLRNDQNCDSSLAPASRTMLSLHEEGSWSRMSPPLTFSEAFTKSGIVRKRKNPKGLLGIAIKTIKLIKRNQLLQEKLAQLQLETRAFIESVMANPENRALRDKMETTANAE